LPWASCKSGSRNCPLRHKDHEHIITHQILNSVFAVTSSVPALQAAHLPLPSLTFEYGTKPKFNESKVALLIENRPDPILAPLMLHFMSVVPPDWRFRFMGSVESIESVNSSVAIREQVTAGKLDLTYIPANMSTASQEEISRFLTTLWLYEQVLQPAEWLLIFQTDSVLCANSPHNLNEFLEYDWVGAPWHPRSRFGGNGGLSLRRVSAIIEILRHQERVDGSEPEDVWLTERLGHRPGSKLANGTTALMFSGEQLSGETTKVRPDPGGYGEWEDKRPTKSKYNSTREAVEAGELIPGLDDWRDGFYEPLGYHTGGSGVTLHGNIWGTPALRKHIWDYCPEVKMTLKMDAASYVPGQCNAFWKRSEDTLARESWLDLNDLGYGTEIIDGDEYPVLPPGLRPW
jgi:hypothetical protein